MVAGAHHALEIFNIEVVYHHTIQALRGLSLRVPTGQIVALLGSNGAGKSTILKAASGVLPLDNGHVVNGRITFGGEDISGKAPHELARRGLGYVREGRHVFVDLTVEENLAAAESALISRAGVKPRPDLVYGYFPRLAERRKQVAGYLSGGEQQMLAIGRTLIGEPKLILLDEPSLGLAPLVVKDIFSKIAQINREQGTAMLIVEQNAHVALQAAGYGYILENGRVVIDGQSSALVDDPDVRRFYLGHRDGATEQASFRSVKHYKRRKRWLS
jgi:branched-chain amino acid transport system ATP-binding protein